MSAMSMPANEEYVSPLTAPATPNLPKTAGASPRKLPVKATAARSPRSPLPPHKLAKLANALGVSTPLPASNHLPLQLKRSQSARPASERSTPDLRSATPLSATIRSPSSRYLIHVVPPKHLPHESKLDAESYKAFRRGSLVPLHATLQSQLNAISREFQLPTAHGLILYLMGDATIGDGVDYTAGKGPRISDEVWKWLCMKVADEQPIMRGVGLGFSSGASSPAPGGRVSPLRKLSTPSQLDSSPILNGSGMYPTPSPSSASTPTAGPSSLSKGKSSPVQNSDSSQSSTNSPTTSNDTRPTSSLELDPRLLPGLGSPSLMPVLAKVEFDIDRRVGAWYDAWSRSRREMLRRKKKAVESKGKLPLKITINDKNERADSSEPTSDMEEGGYARLTDSPENSDAEDELTARVSPTRRDPLADVFASDAETWSNMQSSRPLRRNNGDLALDGGTLSAPNGDLADPAIGGSDSEEVRALWNARNQPKLGLGIPGTPQSSRSKLSNGTPQSNRKQAPPPLTLAPRGEAGIELNIATPTPSPYTAGFENAQDDSHLPYLSQDNSIVTFEDDKFKEKRVAGIFDDIELDLDLSADIDPDESRASQLRMREQLDILERNLAQFSPRELKSIELVPEEFTSISSLRSAPPGLSNFTPSIQGVRGSPKGDRIKHSQRESKRQVPTIQQLRPVQRSKELVEEDVRASPPSFRQPVLVGTPSPIADSFRDVDKPGAAKDSSAEGRHNNSERHDSLQSAWPAVPFVAIVGQGEETPLSSVSQSPRNKGKRLTNSPPKVVLNGKVGDSPKQKRKNNLSVSSSLSSISESQARSRQYEEESVNYPGSMNLPPSLSRRSGEASNSPVLPLSPDPFGRFPSSVTQNANGSNLSYPERTSSLGQNGQTENADPYERPPSKTPSSRFSADSVLEEAAANANLKAAASNRTTLVSMKSIRKLWRKTNKASISTTPSSSTMPSPDPSVLLSRPPSSAASLHDTEYESSRAPSPAYPFPPTHPPLPSGRTSQASVRSLNTPITSSQSNPRAVKSSRPDSGLDPFYFDQDSKYPVRRSPSPQNQVQYGTAPYAPPNGPTPVTEKKRSVRKSILKWKGSSSSANGAPDGSADPRQSTDVSDIRRRRPSIINAAGNMIRGSVASASEDSPSVPELPAEYRTNRQSRASVSTLQNSNANGDERTQVPPVRTNSIRRKPAPSSSTDSSHASTDPIHTPASAIGPSLIPNGNVTLASPRSSDDVRSSFDESQFEIVSPKPGQYNFDAPHFPS